MITVVSSFLYIFLFSKFIKYAFIFKKKQQKSAESFVDEKVFVVCFVCNCIKYSNKCAFSFFNGNLSLIRTLLSKFRTLLIKITSVFSFFSFHIKK